MMKNRISAGIVICTGIIFSCLIRMTNGSMDAEINSVVLLIMFLILLVSESIPVTLICFLILGLMPVTGVTSDFNEALNGFSNQVVFFILASSGMAMALEKVPFSRRLLRMLLDKCGTNSKNTVFSIMACTAVMSSVISNVPTCAVFLSVAMSLLELYPDEQKQKTGKTLMIGIPIASMIGGIMTPAGSSINLLAIGLLEQYTGDTITFIQWMCVGVPLAIVLLPVAWCILVTVFPPAESDETEIKRFTSRLEIPDQILPEEKRVLIITAVMLFFWLLSSWVPSINIMVVTLLGCCIYCWPDTGVLRIEEFIKKVSWDSFFLVGTVLSLGNVLVKNGINDYVINLLPDVSKMPLLICMNLTAMCIFLLLIFIPVAPSLVTFMAPVMIAIAGNMGISPVLTMLVCSMCACNCYILPLDTVCLLTYSKGYYKMTDITKVAVILQLVIIIVLPLWLLSVGCQFGWY